MGSFPPDFGRVNGHMQGLVVSVVWFGRSDAATLLLGSRPMFGGRVLRRKRWGKGWSHDSKEPTLGDEVEFAGFWGHSRSTS